MGGGGGQVREAGAHGPSLGYERGYRGSLVFNIYLATYLKNSSHGQYPRWVLILYESPSKNVPVCQISCFNHNLNDYLPMAIDLHSVLRQAAVVAGKLLLCVRAPSVGS